MQVRHSIYIGNISFSYIKSLLFSNILFLQYPIYLFFPVYLYINGEERVIDKCGISDIIIDVYDVWKNHFTKKGENKEFKFIVFEKDGMRIVDEDKMEYSYAVKMLSLMNTFLEGHGSEGVYQLIVNTKSMIEGIDIKRKKGLNIPEEYINEYLVNVSEIKKRYINNKIWWDISPYDDVFRKHIQYLESIEQNNDMIYNSSVLKLILEELYKIRKEQGIL